MEVRGARDRTLELFAGGFNCAQSVFAGCAPGLGLPEEVALKVSCAFGGGIARTAELCGAVSGALLVIGLRHGRGTLAYVDARDLTYELSRRLLDRFRRQEGSLICRDLLGSDISTAEGLAEARSKNFHADICPRYLAAAVTILGEVLPE
jgi:C_GCAxxG_C_C family probable redox protein